MPTITVQKRKRGVFGWLVSILFWGFNLFMLAWMASTISLSADRYSELTSNASKAGAAIGTTVGVTILLWIWLFGAIIFGLMMVFSRGKKITITKEIP